MFAIVGSLCSPEMEEEEGRKVGPDASSEN